MNTETKLIKFEEGITLESGNHLESFELIVETYGELNKSKSNGVLLCHAFSGNHHAAGKSEDCLLYTSPSPRDLSTSRMPSSA